MALFTIWVDLLTSWIPELLEVTELDFEEAALYYDTNRGVKLEKPLPPITFTVGEFGQIGECDSLWGGVPYQVFSPRLRAFLSDQGVENIEYFPAHIMNKKSSDELPGYAIANILGRIPCMDWNRSDLTCYPDSRRIHSVNRLVLDGDKVPPDASLFRLAEIPSIILCTQELMDSLRGAAIQGVGSQEIERLFL